MKSAIERANNCILGNYKRFPVTFIKGKNNFLYDENNVEYLDFGGGIAVNSLGHAHPEIVETLRKQAQSLSHISNLYYNLPQIDLAEKITDLMKTPSKVFFCNSGAEANECLLKLARKFGNSTGRNEIISAIDSFHGRTFGGMSATGQDKIKKGFEPLLKGFKHVKFNDINDLKDAITDNTCAILIEGIQGESGIIPANEDYLRFIREICNLKNILFLFDSVQCGFFRTGNFQSYQTILNEKSNIYAPDAIAMAKSLGAGFPIGACWISDKYADILDAGSHGSTYGGNPLACSVALKTIEIIEQENLLENIRVIGNYLKSELLSLKNQFSRIKEIRGLGFIIGIELTDIQIPDKFEGLTSAAYYTLTALEHSKLLVIPAGINTIRLLPAFNTTKQDIDLALDKISLTFKKL